MKKNLTEMVFILDRSGSMAGLEADTIAAVRERGMEDETTIIAFSEAAIKECRRLAPEIETLIIPTAQEFAHISSSAVRDILKHGGDYSAFIPEGVKL